MHAPEPVKRPDKPRKRRARPTLAAAERRAHKRLRAARRTTRRVDPNAFAVGADR